MRENVPFTTKPPYTLQEEFDLTVRQVRELSDRLQRFREMTEKEVHDLMRQLTSDNVLFKSTMRESWEAFNLEVKNEVNAFQSTLDSDFELFKTDLTSNYANLSNDVYLQITEKVKEFESKFAEFTEQYNSLVESVNSRIDANNATFSESFADYQRKMTTEINLFEQTVNNTVTNFTESVTNSFETFKTTWTQIVEERLNTQDARISDAELYMKSNLEGTVTALVGDMKANGEFDDIIEGTVFNDLEAKFTHINVRSFGAIGDGVSDDTTAFRTAIENSYGKTLFIPDGVYCVKDLTIENDISFVGSGKNAILKYEGENDCLHIKPVSPKSTDDFIDIALENISIISETGGNAVYLSETTHSIFRNIFIDGFHTGFKMDGGSALISKQNSIFNNHFEEIVIDNVTYGFDIFGCISDSHFDKISISKSEYGFYIHGTNEMQGSNNVTITNSTFVYAKDCIHLNNVHMRNLFINGGNFEQFDEHGIYINPNECDFKVFALCNSLFLPSNNANENTICVELKKCSGGNISNILFQNNNEDVVGIDTSTSMLLYISNLVANNGSTIKHNISKACYHTTYEYENNKDNLVFNTAIRSPRITTDSVMFPDGENYDTLNVVNGNLLFTKGGKNAYLNALLGDSVIKGLNNVKSGTCIFNDTLGKPVWFTGSKWVDATGAEI